MQTWLFAENDTITYVMLLKPNTFGQMSLNVWPLIIRVWSVISHGCPINIIFHAAWTIARFQMLFLHSTPRTVGPFSVQRDQCINQNQPLPNALAYSTTKAPIFHHTSLSSNPHHWTQVPPDTI